MNVEQDRTNVEGQTKCIRGGQSGHRSGKQRLKTNRDYDKFKLEVKQAEQKSAVEDQRSGQV